MKSRSHSRPALGRVLRAGPALVALVLARAGLRALPLPRLTRALGVQIGTERGAARAAVDWLELPRELAVTLADVDAWMRRWPAAAPCLVRALSVGWLLRRSRPTLRIGVARAPDKHDWSAHAWLEVAGITLPEPRHAPIERGRLRALGQG